MKSLFLKKQQFTKIRIDFTISPRWCNGHVPAKAGWYFIETNMPIENLKKIEHNNIKNNCNFAKKISNSQFLTEKGLTITQIGCAPYIVYSGEAANLQSRAREHSFGGKGTGCLALDKYDKIKTYDWYFSFFTCDKYDSASQADKSLRNFGEQIFRAQNGWPILCTK